MSSEHGLVRDDTEDGMFSGIEGAEPIGCQVRTIKFVAVMQDTDPGVSQNRKCSLSCMLSPVSQIPSATHIATSTQFATQIRRIPTCS